MHFYYRMELSMDKIFELGESEERELKEAVESLTKYMKNCCLKTW